MTSKPYLFLFRRIAQDDIVSRMQTIVQSEKADVELGALQLIAQIAAGGMRDALSLLDQAISHAAGKVTLQGVIELTGAVDTRKIGKLIEYIGQKDVEGSLEHFNTCFQSGQEPKFFIEEMMNYYRDILLYEKLGEKATLKKGVTDPAFHEVRKAVNPVLIFHHLDVLQETMGKMKFHHDVHLLVEMALVEMVNEKNEDIRAELIQLRQDVELLKSGIGIEQLPIRTEQPKPIVEQQVVSKEEGSSTSSSHELQGEEMTTLAATEQPVVSKEELPSWYGKVNVPMVEPFGEESDRAIKEFVADKAKDDTPPAVSSVLSGLSLDDLLSDVNTISDFSGTDDKAVESQSNPVELAGEDSSVELTQNEESQHSVIQSVSNVDPLLVVSTPNEEVTAASEFSQPTGLPEGDVIVIDESQIPPPPEDEEALPIEQSEKPLSMIEENVLELLATCTKELKATYAVCAPEVQRLLKETRMSTFALFREFSLIAVSGTQLIMSHPENVKVKLMERVANRSIVESVLAEAYQPLQLTVVSDAQWSRIKNAVLKKNS